MHGTRSTAHAAGGHALPGSAEWLSGLYEGHGPGHRRCKFVYLYIGDIFVCVCVCVCVCVGGGGVVGVGVCLY